MLAAFSAVDTAIVIVYLAASVVIGLVANRLVTGLSGYLVAGRSLGTALSIATMTGSELGLITVMYAAQTGFNQGFKALHIGLIAGIVTLFVGLTGLVVVRLRRHGVMTIPEYYELRFSRRTRVLGGVLLALGGILNMGLFLQVGGQFVVAVTGLDPQGVTLKLVMTGLLALVLFYTVLGGMVSVVLTDYVQFVVLSLGLVLIVWVTIAHLGMDAIVDGWRDRGASTGEDVFSPSGYSDAYVPWQAVLGFVSCAIWPTAVTRALSARNESVVKRQYALSSISFMIRFMIPCFMGVAAYVFLTQGGVVVLEESIEGGQRGDFSLGGHDYNSIQAFPVLLRELLPIGLLGLVTAAMLAAFMSTHDSYLLCWSSVIARDVIAPNCSKPPSDRRQLLWTRVGIVVIGLWVLVFGIFYEPSQDVWDYLGITGAIYFTGAIVVLVGGLYWKRASSVGAMLALCAGFSALVGLGPIKRALAAGSEAFVELGAIEQAWQVEDWQAEWIGLTTLGVAVVAMVVGSLVFPDKKEVA